MRAPAGRASDMDIGEPAPCLHVPLAACRSMKSVITGTGNPAWSGCNMPSPKPGRSPACGPHIKINTSSTRFPQRFRRSRRHRRGHGWHCPCRGVPRGQDPVFIWAPRSPVGPGRRGKSGFGQAGADRSGFKRPGSSPQYIAGRTESAWPAPRLHRDGAGPGAPATVGHQARAFAGEVAGLPEGESQPCCAAFAEGARHGDYRCGHRGVRVTVAGSQAVSAQVCLPVFDGALHRGKAASRFH